MSAEVQGRKGRQQPVRGRYIPPGRRKQLKEGDCAPRTFKPTNAELRASQGKAVDGDQQESKETTTKTRNGDGNDRKPSSRTNRGNGHGRGMPPRVWTTPAPKQSSDKEVDDLSGRMAALRTSQPRPVKKYVPVNAHNPDLSHEQETGHIVEIYDFPSSMQTSQLHGLLSPVVDKVLKIDWLDKTRAIAVFATVDEARVALQTIKHAYFKMRPFSEASRTTKAEVNVATLPRAARKPRDTSTAERLITRALNIRTGKPRRSRAELDAIKAQEKAARAERRARRQREQEAADSQQTESSRRWEDPPVQTPSEGRWDNTAW